MLTGLDWTGLDWLLLFSKVIVDDMDGCGDGRYTSLRVCRFCVAVLLLLVFEGYTRYESNFQRPVINGKLALKCGRDCYVRRC